MFLEERHQQIIELLDADGRVTVTDLATRFDVTEDCIRKDLKQLAAEGKCRRVYGGATKPEGARVRKVSTRIDLYDAEKNAIAAKAFELIAPKQTVYLDISTTNLRVARLLAQAGIECTVVSPMIDVLTAVAPCPTITGICPGGTMHPELSGFVGGLAVSTLQRFRFDAAFMGTFGIDAEAQEVTTYDMGDGLLKTCAIERSTRSYLVSEVRKVGEVSTYRFAGLSDFDAWICDDPASDDARQVAATGLEVL